MQHVPLCGGALLNSVGDFSHDALGTAAQRFLCKNQECIYPDDGAFHRQSHGKWNGRGIYGHRDVIVSTDVLQKKEEGHVRKKETLSGII